MGKPGTGVCRWRDDRGYYEITYYDARGERRREAKGKDKSAAELALAERMKRALLVAEGILPEAPNTTKVSDLRAQYEAWQKLYCREDTQDSTKRFLTQVFKAVPAETVAGITEQAVLDYMDNRVTAKRAPKTINNRIGALKMTLNWGVEHHLIASNPIANIRPLPDDGTRPRRALTPEETVKLLTLSKPVHARIWFTFLSTGLRRKECTRLQWRDIDFDAKQVIVREKLAKTHKEDRLPMCAELHDMLKAMKTPTAAPLDFVFVNRKGKPWGPDLRMRLRCSLKLAGIDPTGVDVHSLRYTFITSLVRSGANIKAVQELARHKTVEITLRIYTQVFPSDKIGAMQLLPYRATPLPPMKKPQSEVVAASPLTKTG